MRPFLRKEKVRARAREKAGYPKETMAKILREMETCTVPQRIAYRTFFASSVAESVSDDPFNDLRGQLLEVNKVHIRKKTEEAAMAATTETDTVISQ
jgi:hypothetical protein